MSEIRFDTPEDVEVAYEPAGPGTRFLAWVIDGIFITIALFIIGLGLFMLAEAAHMGFLWRKPVDPDHPETLFWYALALSFLLNFIVNFFYYFFFEMFMGGQSPGKKYTRIQVIQEGGFALSPAASFLRNLFRIVDNLPPCWAVLLLSPKHQRIGDYVARTLVVSKMEVPHPPTHTRIPFHSELPFRQFEFTAEHLSRLTDQDLELLESYHHRRNRLSGPVRNRLRHKICDALRTRLEIPAHKTFRREDRFLFEIRALLHEQSTKRQI